MSTELFDHAAEQLERATELDRLETRGTLRLALKQAGLETKKLTLQQLDVVFEKVMPGELETRGIDSAATTCRTVMAEITRSAGSAGAPPTGSVDEVFRRLGGE
jgi:hypothetical protein